LFSVYKSWHTYPIYASLFRFKLEEEGLNYENKSEINFLKAC
jgi:hypothetical protein